jgi:glycosyltransferase involved in cell wall biosynthesis
LQSAAHRPNQAQAAGGDVPHASPEAFPNVAPFDAAGGVVDAPATVDVAVVIPAFNEAGAVGRIVTRVREALSSTPYSFDVVVVDDGSTDATALEAELHGGRVVRQPENGGYGAALKRGINETQSEYVVITDADGTYPPEQIPALLLRAETQDMVVGSRAMTDVSIPVIRRPAKMFLGALASFLSGRHIPDLNSGLRVMRRSVLTQFLYLLPSGFSFTSTITLAMLCTQHRVLYIPVTCAARVGSSKIRPRDFTAFLMLVLRTIVLFNPLKVFLPLGTFLFAVGLVKLAYDVYLWNLSETAVMAFLSAVIVWAVGLLADMISRLQLNLPRR